jgi:hypothetical protein
MLFQQPSGVWEGGADSGKCLHLRLNPKGLKDSGLATAADKNYLSLEYGKGDSEECWTAVEMHLSRVWGVNLHVLAEAAE